MIKKKEKVRYEGARPLLVMPYIIAISAAMMYTICRDYALVCTVIMSVFSGAVYMLIYRFRKNPAGAAVVALALVAVCGASLLLVGSLGGEKGFVDFVFTASTFFSPIYAAVSIVLFSAVTGFICCYFSAVLPRMCFLLLAAFIPLILSARTSGALPIWLLAPLMGSYLLALCGSARECLPQDVSVFRDNTSKKQRAVAALCISVAAVLLASVIPRSNKTPMGDYLDRVFTQGDGYYNGSEMLTNFASRSSVNTGDNVSSNNLLFTVQTESPMLIDRWVFDAYDGEKGWHYLEDFNTGYAGWEQLEAKCRPAELSNALRRAARSGKIEGYDQLAEISRELTDTQYMFIRVMDGSSTKVVLHPVPTEEVEITGYKGEIYRTPKGELFTDRNISEGEYLITYHAEETSVEFANALHGVDFEVLLYEAASREIIDSTTYNAFSDEYKRAQNYKMRTLNKDKVSAELQQLANEIIEGCTTDYDKAYAIEQWFSSNGFVYDLDFVPKKAEVDYFLFQSRRGICSDYATAVTLMARAVGLPARYVEGFMLSEENCDENGVYRVTSSNTHAYTQIYIKGCGWVNFDATEYVETAGRMELTPLQIVILVICCVLALTAVILAVIFRERLGWLMFSMVYPLYNQRAAVRALAKRMRKLAAHLTKREAEVISMGEAERIITQRLNMGQQAAQIRAAADLLLYSGESSASFDKKQLHRCMADILRRKRRMRR